MARRSIRGTLQVVAVVALATALVSCGSSSDDSKGTKTGGEKTPTANTLKSGGAPPSLPAAATTATVDPAADGAATDPNIVGGLPVRVEDTPWLAALVNRGSTSAQDGQFCGGVLITSTIVMTAAHCLGIKSNGQGGVTGRPVATIDVVLGRTNLDDPGGERIAVTGYEVPKSYDRDRDVNDMALLRLATASTETPVLLMPTGSTYGTQSGQTARIQGWGCETPGATRDECGTAAPVDPNAAALKAGTVIFQSTQDCQAANRFDAASMLCARGEGNSQITCFGDSGGPISATFTDGTSGLVGLVSFGESARCNANELDFYTYVRPVFDTWIASGDSWVAGTT